MIEDTMPDCPMCETSRYVRDNDEDDSYGTHLCTNPQHPEMLTLYFTFEESDMSEEEFEEAMEHDRFMDKLMIDAIEATKATCKFVDGLWQIIGIGGQVIGKGNTLRGAFLDSLDEERDAY